MWSWPRLAIRSEPVPIEDAVGRVAVLLNLDNEITGANRVQAPAGQKQSISRLNRDAMNM